MGPPLAAGIAVDRVDSAIAHGLCDSATEADTVSDPSPSPFEALDEQERQEKIDTAVASMAPDVRAVWNGLAYDGISWSELGRREGLSDNGARKRYKAKFLDAFIAVGLGEYYGGDSDEAGFASNDISAITVGTAKLGSAMADGLCDSGMGAATGGGKNKGVKYGQKQCQKA
jgi:hypothetical protein